MNDPVVVWAYGLVDAVTWTVSLLEAGLLQDSEETMKRIKSYYPVTMIIDGDSVVLHIRRMPTLECEQFDAAMKSFGYSMDGSIVVPTLVPDGGAVATWLVETISANVTLPPGQLSVEDEAGQEHEVRTGVEMIAQFGGRVDLIPTLVAFIWGENRLPEQRKAAFRNAVASGVAAVVGPIPVPGPVPSPPDEEGQPRLL